ncbi:hypothetical protein CHU98_g12507 [Xylaria longipes]|nr:hypothetical protein CHU98_g12507 [Xylaria longipes]
MIDIGPLAPAHASSKLQFPVPPLGAKGDAWRHRGSLPTASLRRRPPVLASLRANAATQCFPIDAPHWLFTLPGKPRPHYQSPQSPPCALAPPPAI